MAKNTSPKWTPRDHAGAFVKITPRRDHRIELSTCSAPDLWTEKERMLFAMVIEMQGATPEIVWGRHYEDPRMNGTTYILKTSTGGVFNPVSGWTPREVRPECVLSDWQVEALKAELGDDLKGLEVHEYSRLEAVAPLYKADPEDADELEPADCIEEADTFYVDVLIRFPSTGEEDILVERFEERDVGHAEISDVVDGLTHSYPGAEVDDDLLEAIDTLGRSAPKL